MRAWRIITLYLAGVFLGGALLAPWLHWLAESVVGPPKSADEVVSFGRFVTRSFTIMAVLGLWPLLHALKMNSLLALGLVFRPGWGRQLATGFALGFASLALVVVAFKLAGQRVFLVNLSAGALALRVIEIAASALAVGIVEEVLFRGALFGALRREGRFVSALLASSVIYAWLHFLERNEGAGEVGWLSGLQMLPDLFAGLFRWDSLMPALLNLLVAGMLLGWAYERTGSLFLSIGLHAGWVFWLKIYGTISNAVPNRPAKWFWGTWRLTDGWATLCAMGVLFTVMWFIWRYKLSTRRP